MIEKVKSNRRNPTIPTSKMHLTFVTVLVISAVLALADSDVGGQCQSTPTGLVCKTGLTCVFPTNPTPGGFGICQQNLSDVGGQCQPSVLNGAACKPGLVCILPSQPTPGGFGTCQDTTSASTTVVVPTTRAPSDVGGQCQPSVQNGARCASGLVCVMPSPPTPGGFGVCQDISSPTSVATTAVTSSPIAPTTTPTGLTTINQSGAVEVGGMFVLGLVTTFLM
ncbi:hypothetical protein BCR33DRAFT_733223 [Rhizoclosmatium globosum]|uniref:IGFBP N-terminal domain-containing protein n=1 Tax=Rhizoclosmatium globosum TaxID=329046 RepID=A0A1Y2CZR9_9FUNG|nr:hypothetical protein BCR33DRAFT_733223 [Rhizoclosmatium globosum]|eukprot:ORY52533.1 hypothetical protein BCR33DRAFT_733223 [Rhizoclosmatium globosum]